MIHYPNQPLSIEEYDPIWAVLYEDEKKKIIQKLGQYVSEVEHIGSTAIPGLSAKPVIDILVSLRSENDGEKCLKLLEDLEYEYVDKPDQWYLRKNTGKYTGFHVHMIVAHPAYWTKALAIKKYLLTHPTTAQEYSTLKERLFEQYGDDRTAYRNAKTAFVMKLIEAALKE